MVVSASYNTPRHWVLLAGVALSGCGAKLPSSSPLKEISQPYKALTFQQKLDHVDSQDKRVFSQRYLVDSTFAEGDSAPIIFFISGEFSLFESHGADKVFAEMRRRAKLVHGHFVALEHRYYGKSMPMTDQKAASMKYLSVEQALADLNDFVVFMREQQNLKGPWIAIGGSYPGSMAAYFRALHPNLVTAALASSAPVKAQVDFPEYDEHAARSFGTKCAGDMRRLVNAFDDAVDHDPAALAKMKVAFGLEATSDNLDMARSIDLSNFAQGGHFEDVCRAVEPVDSYQALTSLAQFFKDRRASQMATASQADPYDEQNGTSWFWQLCTEFGYWYRASDNRELSIMSRLMTLDAQKSMCQVYFGIDGVRDADTTNAKYYSHLFLPDTTRILYTNGSNDPWSELSIVNDTSEALQRDIHAIQIPGSSHIWDLFAPKADDLPELQAARQTSDEAILRWVQPSNK